MRYSAVLFDLDGTLVDSMPDIAGAANAMLTELNYATLPIHQITSFVGKGIPNLVKRTLTVAANNAAPTDTLFDQGVTLFYKHYNQLLLNPSTTLFPDVLEGLDAFKQTGVKMAIVTNKAIEFVPAVIQNLHIAHYFDFIVGGDTCSEKKPHPLPFLYACEQLQVQPQHSLVIGDSANDSLAANAAGMDVLLVPYGYNEGNNVHELASDGVVSSIKAAARWAIQAKPLASR